MNALPPLRQRVIGASIWSLGGFGLSQLIRFGGNLLLTRLLAPDMFGVMAIATVVMSTLAVLSDIGLKQNVVQSRRGSDGRFLDTVWTIQILRGFQLAVAILAVAGIIFFVQHFGLVAKANVYADSRVPFIVASVSVGAIIYGFTSTKAYEASRNLQIQRTTLIEIASQIVALSLMLSWVMVSPTIWALVAGGIGTALTAVTLSHAILAGHRNRLEWDREAVREVFTFGKWILLSSIAGAVMANLDRILLAGMTDPTTLGVYAIAFNLFLVTEQLLMRAVSAIGYAAISEIVRSRPDNLQAAYYKLHMAVALSAYLSCGLLSVLAPKLVQILYDARYADAGWMLQILSFGLLIIPSQLALQTFIALNKPQVNTAINLLRLVLILVAMPIGFLTFGFPGALVGLVASSVTCIIVIAVCSVRMRFYDWRRELLPLPAIALGMLAGQLVLLILR